MLHAVLCRAVKIINTLLTEAVCCSLFGNMELAAFETSEHFNMYCALSGRAVIQWQTICLAHRRSQVNPQHLHLKTPRGRLFWA